MGMTHQAKKVVIITEQVIRDKVAKIIEECEATGYTITKTGGKGSRGVRNIDRAAIADDMANIKMEVIVSDQEHAEMIARRVVDTYFTNYSGITYIEDVEIIRPDKFQV